MNCHSDWMLLYAFIQDWYKASSCCYLPAETGKRVDGNNCSSGHTIMDHKGVTPEVHASQPVTSEDVVYQSTLNYFFNGCSWLSYVYFKTLHRITETPNGLSWKGAQGSSSSNPNCMLCNNWIVTIFIIVYMQSSNRRRFGLKNIQDLKSTEERKTDYSHHAVHQFCLLQRWWRC